ncbi:MAG: SDR family oxidoreductase [SAR202 cluster bacterium]|jgi:NAD(P)-dependent dehydrogenase (short-subunit alcohol dehydrogenase family)|nr:hypothetical protein [Chloroflexota bacterium]MQG68612.1 SDR family oxidoreductase [SAR202 cluster bacterium]HAL46223.1 hypothetical protein [Dehalococcoidia bacterium]|tara:strand:- start:39 stop:788 length:750 start_codon:yes stop_codon:yes gene_type:complete
MPISFSLAGKNAIVTGGSRNMGRQFALALADAGANVAILDLPVQEKEAQGVIGELRERGVRGVYLPLDLRDVDAIREQVAALAAEFGHLDILINNAGKTGGTNKPFLEYEVDAFDDMQAIGLRGTYFMSQAVANRMVDLGMGGSIIHISSRMGMQLRRGSSAYSTVKAGIAHMGRAMALDLAQYNIRVNSIAPGPVSSSDESDAEFPLPTGLRYEDLPGTAVFLASDASRMITGQVIMVAGGIDLRGPI